MNLFKKTGKTVYRFSTGAAGGIVDQALSLTFPFLWSSLKGGVNSVIVNRGKEYLEFFINNTEAALLKNQKIIDALIIGLENYIKERSQIKRDIIQRIYIGFKSNADKERFQMERLYGALSRISLDAVEYIFFLRKEIIPSMQTEIEMESQRVSKSEGAKDLNWWRNHLKRTTSISDHIFGWINKYYDPGSPDVKFRYNYDSKKDKDKKILAKMFDEKRPHVERAEEILSEMESLGLLRGIIEGGGAIGEGSTKKFVFTDFGWDFIYYLDDSEYPPISLNLAAH